MKIKKIASDLFNLDPEEENQRLKRVYEAEFKIQDEMAEKSEIFNKILQSEISDDQKIRFKQTSSPKSKTRNALLSRWCYQNQEEWEKNLLTNPFYELSRESSARPFMRSMPYGSK